MNIERKIRSLLRDASHIRYGVAFTVLSLVSRPLTLLAPQPQTGCPRSSGEVGRFPIRYQHPRQTGQTAIKPAEASAMEQPGRDGGGDAAALR